MKRHQVTAFIDWNSQLANAGQRAELKIDRQVKRTANFVAERLSNLLQRWDSNADLFNVDLRIYYGWHRGLSPTPSRLTLKNLILQQEIPHTFGKARFDWQNPFGDILLSAYDHRLNPRIRVHLPNTLRASLDGGNDREKMVDSALVCDLLSCTRSDPQSLRIVMAEDDDVIPAVFVSERWGKDHGGKTFIARTRDSSNFLVLDNLVWQL